MREIKFRAFDKEFNEMIIDPHCHIDNYNGDINHEFKNNDDVIWMQYTGLKDKNGKEIYEGDIDTDDHNNLSVICYIEKYGAYCAVPLVLYLHEDYENEVVYEYGYDCYFQNCIPKKYIKIIGNIYENPELLGESK